MTRAERTLRRIGRLEFRAVRASMRATRQKNAFGRAAIRAGQVADGLWSLARRLRQLLIDREAAKGREKKKQKMERDWWRISTNGKVRR